MKRTLKDGLKIELRGIMVAGNSSYCLQYDPWSPAPFTYHHLEPK
jgi:hypothetical protein